MLLAPSARSSFPVSGELCSLHVLAGQQVCKMICMLTARHDGSESDVLTILELVEVGGMPQLMVALATEEIRSRVLGEVLAETIQVCSIAGCYCLI